MNHTQEHPDWRWSADSISPPLPDDWEDISWHNDAHPSWRDPSGRLHLWIDYEDEGDRDVEGQHRIHLWDEVTDEVVLATDDLQTALDRAAQIVGQRKEDTDEDA
jgi:hypothetical protein